MSKYNSLPRAVQDLARRGERYRFPGFWLYDTPRDRIVAAWLDRVTSSDTPVEDRVNVAELVKDFLYQIATGQTADKTVQAVISILGPKLEAIDRKLTSGVVLANNSTTPDDSENAEEVYDALSGMED